MDKVEVLLELEEMVEEVTLMKIETFTFVFKADGYSLEFAQRQVCTMCSNDNHYNSDCQILQKLLSASVKGWSFVIPADGLQSSEHEP